MRIVLLGTLLAVLARGADGPADALKKDLGRLQGTWQSASLTYDGKEEAGDKYGFRLVFKGTQATVEAGEAVQKDYGKLTFKFDPTTTPKCVDVKVSAGGQLNVEMEGIYEVKGDELKLNLNVFGKERPTEFTSPAGKGFALVVLKRVQ